MHYLLRNLICKTAIIFDKKPEKISFKKTINTITNKPPSLASLSSEQIIQFKINLINQISKAKFETNRGCQNPRAVKRKISPFPVKPPNQPCNMRFEQTVQVVGP